MTPKISVDHCNVETDSSKGSEAHARTAINAELAHLIELAADPSTIQMSIGAVIQSVDNQLQYRNANGEFRGDYSASDNFQMGWRHAVSPTVIETYQRLADQLIPEYIPDGRYTELNLGNANINFTSREIAAIDCMCDDSTVDDED